MNDSTTTFNTLHWAVPMIERQWFHHHHHHHHHHHLLGGGFRYLYFQPLLGMIEHLEPTCPHMLKPTSLCSIYTCGAQARKAPGLLCDELPRLEATSRQTCGVGCGRENGEESTRVWADTCRIYRKAI